MKRTFKRVDYTMLRGLEIAVMNKGPARFRGDGMLEHLKRPENAVELRYNSLTDLLFFEVFGDYVRDLPRFLGPWRHLYIRVDDMSYTARFYLVPVGLVILFARWLRKVWMMPARWVYYAGYLKCDQGDTVPLFWPVRVRLRRQARP